MAEEHVVNPNVEGADELSPEAARAAGSARAPLSPPTEAEAKVDALAEQGRQELEQRQSEAAAAQDERREELQQAANEAEAAGEPASDPKEKA